MADRIKGITVEIGGDVTKLNEALRDVNKQINSTQSALKDVERLLKMDPSNTELLAQKQKLLTKAIEDTETKLKTLKDAEKQAQEQFQRGEISQEQYDALKREIIATEQELTRLRDQAEQSSVALQKMTQAGQKLKDVGGALTSAGQKLLPVTGAVAAAAAAGAASFADVDKTMQLTLKTMGATAGEADTLNQAMKDAASSSVYGMTDAANATLNFARAGLDAEQAAAALAPAMNLAAGEGGDLDTVSAGLVATINGFHGAFADAGKYADVFAAACNNSALDVNSLSSAMSVAAPIFASAGYTVNDAALYMGVMANNGIEADKAANSLKTGIARLVSPAKEGATMMEALGISVTNADGSMKDSITIQEELNKAFSQLSESEQIAAASAIFGKNQMAPWLALINTAPADVKKLNDSLANCAGTTEEMANTMMGGFGGSIEQLKSSIDVLVYSLGEALAPILSQVVGWIQSVVDKLNGMSESGRTTAIVIGGIAAAIGPLLIIIGKIATGVGAVMTIIPKLVAAFQAVQGAIAIVTGAAATGSTAATALAGAFTALTGPIGIVIAAIAGIVAAVVVLWNNCESFRDAVTAAWEFIKTAFQGFLDWLQATFAPVWDAVVAAAQTVFQGFQTAVTMVWEAIQGVFQIFTDFLQETFGVTWGDVFTGVQTVTETVGAAIQAVVQVLTTIFQGLVTFLVDNFLVMFKQAIQGALDFLTAFKDSVIQIIDGVKTIFQGIIDFVTGVFTGDWSRAWEGVKEIFRGVFEALVGIAKIPINGVIGLINKAIDAINFFIRGINKALSLLSAFGVSAPQIPEINKIAYLATGGILEAGNAIVGERGPELLSMVNGRARVTPLTDGGGQSGSGTASQAAGYNQTLNFYAAAMTPAEVARQTRNATRKMIAGVTA